MARSRYIYLALIDTQPVMAFTVKHELVSWLRHWLDTPAGQLLQHGLRLWRLDDGESTPHHPLTVDDLLGPQEDP